LQGALQKKLQLTDKISAAFSIIAYNNKLFVTGFENNTVTNIATLWIVNRDGSIYKTTSLALSAEYDLSAGRSLTISNNQLYITGEQIAIANSSSSATLWIVDIEGNSSNPRLLDAVLSVGKFIEANNNKLYIIGEQRETTTTRATLWIIRLDGIVESITPLTENSGSSLAFLNNRIYIVGNFLDVEDGFYQSRSWITQMDGAFDQTIQWLSDPNKSFASSVKSFDNHILVAGSTNTTAAGYAVLWVLKPDGSLSKTIPLGSSSAQSSIANSIYLLDQTPKTPKTLNNAFKTFSLFKYQKGV
jgi:hypothetical protein